MQPTTNPTTYACFALTATVKRQLFAGGTLAKDDKQEGCQKARKLELYH
jgi:hypothetical protein